jgi:hypothetical protein
MDLVSSDLKGEMNLMVRWRCLNFWLSTPSLDFRWFLYCCWLKAKSRRIHDSNAQVPHGRRQLTRVNSTNVLDEGLRIGEIGRRMNSRVRLVEISVYWK